MSLTVLVVRLLSVRLRLRRIALVMLAVAMLRLLGLLICAAVAVAVALIVALAAGPAMAQGTFAPGYKRPGMFGSTVTAPKKPTPPNYGIPPSPAYGSAPRQANPGGYAPIVGPRDPPAVEPHVDRRALAVEQDALQQDAPHQAARGPAHAPMAGSAPPSSR